MHTFPPTEFSFEPWPWLDSLYDYAKLVASPTGLATLPAQSYGTEVAVIGAGAAGLVAAYELMRCGLKPVIYETTDRIGGRLWSKSFTDKDGTPSKVFAELGAMRFPSSGKTFQFYSKLLQLELSQKFPNPGKVPTLLSYYGENVLWEPGTPVPEPYNALSETWLSYLDILLGPLYEPWKKGDINQLRDVWQRYLHRFRRMNFGEVLHDVLPWTDEELSRFGALGVGTGGFDVFFPLGFTEFMRLLANGCENDQALLVQGCEVFATMLFKQKVLTPLGEHSLSSFGELHLNTTVTSLVYEENSRKVRVTTDVGLKPCDFSAVIAAVPLGRLQHLGLVDSEILTIKQREALQNLHTINSSKLFIRTEKKFWKNLTFNQKPFPQVILTEQAPRASYFLDYPQTEQGVVCLSYTWEDDSQKWSSYSAAEQYQMFRSCLVKNIPELDQHLHPINDEIIRVIWQKESWSMGAFKLNFPGHDEMTRRLFYQYQSVLNSSSDKGVYLAGDSVSWSGGWIEGALHTGLNSVCAVLKRLNGTFSLKTPLDIDPLHLHY
jgi:tryptophan 2-monooxygenase